MDRDLPRGWVMPDVAIHELAQSRPQTREALLAIESVPRGTAARAADEILAALHDSPDDPAIEALEELSRPGPAQVRQLKTLQQRLHAIAGELGIQPEVLATRRELAALVRGGA